MTYSIASMVSRLTSPGVRSTSIPRFVAGVAVTAATWEDWASSQPSQTLKELLSKFIDTDSSSTSSKGNDQKGPKVIILGEQHHQPKVLAAQLQVVQTLATEPFNLKITIIMEHFNLLQQSILSDFGRSGNAAQLQEEYAKSKEGFRIDNTGYLPLLNLARELENVRDPIEAGFPPREWARIVMRQGKDGLLQDEATAKTGLLNNFDRWDDLNVSPEHAAYISSSISGEKPEVQAEVSQGGLKAAQAFKDAIMAWKIDNEVEHAQNRQLESGGSQQEVIVAICGSGHCEYDFGVTERIRSCKRNEILLLVSKPEDSTFWRSSDTKDDVEHAYGRRLADGIMVYEAIDV